MDVTSEKTLHKNWFGSVLPVKKGKTTAKCRIFIQVQYFVDRAQESIYFIHLED